jgi:hypothetical protein
MPVTRSNMDAPLEPPLSHHRRINSASALLEHPNSSLSSPSQSSPRTNPSTHTRFLNPSTVTRPFPPPSNTSHIFPPPSPTVNNVPHPPPSVAHLPPSTPTVNNVPPPPSTVDNDHAPRPFSFNIPRTPPPHNVTQGDLLAAMREQQFLFQQEREASRLALREQHEFMAEQQRQLMSLLVIRAPKPDDVRTQEPSHNTTSHGPKVRMADPPKFDGSIKDTENFLSSLGNIFDAHPSSFPTDESKIRYSLTFLTGNASNWRKLLLRDINDGNFDVTGSSWNGFLTRFKESFGNPHLVDEARRKLWSIRQGSRTSEDFFLEFEETRLEADVCENSLIMFLQVALRPSILHEVLRRDPVPISYKDWKAASLRADHNQRNNAATKSFQALSNNNPSYRQNSFLPFRNRFPVASANQTTATQTTSTSSSGNPPPTANQHSYLKPRVPGKKNDNCWKCGKEGHFSNKCPENAQTSKLRALFDHCDELDAAYETTSSGAEYIRKMLESQEDEDCHEVIERYINEHPVFVEYDE